MSSSLADDEYNFFCYPSHSCFLAITERWRLNAVSRKLHCPGCSSSRQIARLLDYGAHVAPGLVCSSLNSRPRTALSPLGRYHAQRTFGLPMVDRSQYCTRSLSFMLSTTQRPAPVRALEHRSSHCVSYPKIAPALEDQHLTRIGLMKSQRRLQKISAGISLIILSLGFSFLGLLSFFNKPHADLANVPCVDSAYWIAGSSASLLAGTTFLVASCVYWRRYP
jgi:hypothetical protein